MTTPMPATSVGPPTVFISHSSEDAAWRDKIVHHLAPLEEGGVIRIFSNSCEDSEGEWNIAGPTEAAMAETVVALLLLSADSLASQSFMSFDAEFFVNKANYGEVVIIPVLLFDCEWKRSALLAPLDVFRYCDLPLDDVKLDQREAALDSLATAILAGAHPMFPAYFETEFKLSTTVKEWPAEFVIVTAYAPTGEEWSPEQNQNADECLERDLRGKSEWMVRITGFNPSTGHAESGWAFVMTFADACDLGRQYLQDAIYHIQGDQLSVTYCDERRKLVLVGKFRERVKVVA